MMIIPMILGTSMADLPSILSFSTYIIDGRENDAQGCTSSSMGTRFHRDVRLSADPSQIQGQGSFLGLSNFG